MRTSSMQKKMEKPLDPVVKVTVSPDLLEASLIIDPPKTDGSEVTAAMIDNAIRTAKITYGLNIPLLQNIKASPQYNRTYIIAAGNPPKHGIDGSIEFLFQTTISNRPKAKEDGSIDYRDLGIVINVKGGQLLAKIALPTLGVEGMSVLGKKISPTAGRSVASPIGRNTTLSDDGTELRSAINGHVTLNGERVNVLDTFIVSNDVGTSTGNIKSVANVSVIGSVSGGFEVKAAGNIDIGHNVEGGNVSAGGNLSIHGGVVGMNSSKISCTGNLSSSFFENCNIVCGSSIKTESLMNCNVKCGNKLELYGIRAKIVGGRYVIGGDLTANEIGSFSSIPTEIILGADPSIMTRYSALAAEIKQLNDQIPKLRQIVDLLMKYQQAGQLPYNKKIMLQNSSLSLTSNLQKLEADNNEYKMLNEQIQNSGKGKIICRGTMYRGVKITIGFASMTTENDITSSRFSLVDDKIVVSPTSAY